REDCMLLPKLRCLSQAARSSLGSKKSAYRFHPTLEGLEERLLLSADLLSSAGTASVGVHILPLGSNIVGPSSGPTPSGGYSPSQIQHAYGFDQISFNGIVGDGRGQTIAIIDAYDQPNIVNDLATFDS